MPTQPYKLIPDKSKVDPRLMDIIAGNPKWWTGKPVRLPGTTTVISRFKDSGALMYWANQEGLAGRPLRGEESTMEKAAEAGTLAHLLVECDIRGLQEPDLSGYDKEIVAKAESSFLAYLEWKAQTKLKPVQTEISLMSERWLYGGTIDAVQLDGKLALLDWKTSSGIYEDHIVQVGGAYSILWKENFPDQPITSYHIVRFSKVEADLAHHTWQNLEICEKAFIEMRILFEIMKSVKERL